MKTIKVVAAVICDNMKEKNKIFATASPGRQEFCDSCDSFSQKYAGAVSCKEKVGV